MSTTQEQSTVTVLKKGYGFNVGQDFARATADLPIELSPAEYAGGARYVIGYIAEQPQSTLGFLRHGHNGLVRVQALRESISEGVGSLPLPQPPSGARLMDDNEAVSPQDMYKDGPRADWEPCGNRFGNLPVATIRQRRESNGLHFATRS